MVDRDYIRYEMKCLRCNWMNGYYHYPTIEQCPWCGCTDLLVVDIDG